MDQSDKREPSIPQPKDDESIPTMQKLFDRPFLLLGLGMLVMMIFYTGWGVFEILTLPQSKLP